MCAYVDNLGYTKKYQHAIMRLASFFYCAFIRCVRMFLCGGVQYVFNKVHCITKKIHFVSHVSTTSFDILSTLVQFRCRVTRFFVKKIQIPENKKTVFRKVVFKIFVPIYQSMQKSTFFCMPIQ